MSLPKGPTLLNPMLYCYIILAVLYDIKPFIKMAVGDTAHIKNS